MICFRECDASYLETGNYHTCIDPVALEDVEAAFRLAKNSILEQSCKNGSVFLVNKAIEKGATAWNLGLWGACRGGHRELVDLMIEKGATEWNYGLQGACEGGHRELADWMIKKGATNAHILPLYFS